MTAKIREVTFWTLGSVASAQVGRADSGGSDTDSWMHLYVCNVQLR